ncbi:hypothetical protein Gohar_020390, partial [Gossypium harknessii]|nr:hypothetical protein [Gossypium harknessii]
DCPNARAILTIGGLGGRIINNDFSSCIDWLEKAMRVLDKKVMIDFITILWNSWNNRNNILFQSKEEATWVIWERVKSLSKEFRIHNVINRPILPPHFVDKKWEKPPTDKVKINFDAAIINDKIGFGVLARDSEGFAELYTFEESIKVARSLNIAKAIFETDCASLANRIRNRRVDITIMRHRINDLFKSKDMLNNVEFKWVNRNCNKSTNFMSKYAITNNCNLNFGMDYLMAIPEFVMTDILNRLQACWIRVSLWVACQTTRSPFCELLEYMQTKTAVFPWFVRALLASWVREFSSLSSHSLPHIQLSGETYPDCE